MKYDVVYPGGKVFSVSGTFNFLPLDDWLIPTIDTGKQILVLDQRAIVRLAGRVIYEPARNLDGLSIEMRGWFA